MRGLLKVTPWMADRNTHLGILTHCRGHCPTHPDPSQKGYVNLLLPPPYFPSPEPRVVGMAKIYMKLPVCTSCLKCFIYIHFLNNSMPY